MENQDQDAMENLLQSMEKWKIKPPESQQKQNLMDSSIPLISQPWDSWPSSGISSLGDCPMTPLENISSPFRLSFSPLHKGPIMFDAGRPQSNNPYSGPRSLSPFDRPQSLPPLERPLSTSPFEKSHPDSGFIKGNLISSDDKSCKFLPSNRSPEPSNINNMDLSSNTRKQSDFSVDSRKSDIELITDYKVKDPDFLSSKHGYGEPHMFQLASPRSPRLGNKLLKDPRSLNELDNSNYVQEQTESIRFHPLNSTVIRAEDSGNCAKNTSACMDITSISVVPENLTGISSVVDPDTSKCSLQTKSSTGLGLNRTQLQDINDSILLEISGVSVLQDAENCEMSTKDHQTFNEFKMPLTNIFEKSKKSNKSAIKETIAYSALTKPIKEKSLNSRWKSIIGGSNQNLLDEISDSVLHLTCNTDPGCTSQSSSGSGSNQDSCNLGQSSECHEREMYAIYSQVENCDNQKKNNISFTTSTETKSVPLTPISNTQKCEFTGGKMMRKFNSESNIYKNIQTGNESLDGENYHYSRKQILRPAKLLLSSDNIECYLRNNQNIENEVEINFIPPVKKKDEDEVVSKNNIVMSNIKNKYFNSSPETMASGFSCEMSSERNQCSGISQKAGVSLQHYAESKDISQVELYDELVQMIHLSHSQNASNLIEDVEQEGGAQVPTLNLENGKDSVEELSEDKENTSEVKISCSEGVDDEKLSGNSETSNESIESSDDLKDTLSSKGTFKSTGSTTDELLKTVLNRLENTIKSTSSVDETLLINIDSNLTGNNFSPTLVNSPFGLSNPHSINLTNPTTLEMSIKSSVDAGLQTPMEPLRSQHSSGEMLQSPKKFYFNDLLPVEDRKAKDCSIILDLDGFDADKFKEGNVKKRESYVQILQDLQYNAELQPRNELKVEVENELFKEEMIFQKDEVRYDAENYQDIKRISPSTVFEGIGESDNSFLSAASHASNSPASSEPFPGEDLVDALFSSCLPDDNGCVLASQLAWNLSQALSEQQPRWVVESLKDALLSEGCDANLDLPRYRQMLTTWLYQHGSDPSVQALANISNNGINRKLATHQFSEEIDEIASEIYTDLNNVTFEEKFVDNSDFFNHLDEFPSNPTTPVRGSQALHDHLRRTLGGQIPSANRRSTLLPWVRNGLGVNIANADSVVMSRPPSPISPAASTLFTSHHNNSAFTPVEGNSHEESYRVTFDVKPESQRRLDYTYGSLEDEAGTPKLDPGELQHEVHELCHTNKRLHGENAELTTYLTQAEDANCSLRDHCRQLEHDLSSIKDQLADARRLEAELEEVRSRLEAEKDEKGELCDRLTHLERDNCTLQERIHELSAQVRHAQEEVEMLTQKEECLIQEHQVKVAQLTEEVSFMREHSVLQDKTSKQLNTTILDLRKVTQVLEDEKNGLEEQLGIVREELELATSMHCTNMQKEIQDITEEDDVLSDPKTPYNIFGSGSVRGSAISKRRLPWVPHLYSTPYHSRLAFMNSDTQTPSIHSEMQALGEKNGSLPFCEKSESGSSFQSPFKSNIGGRQVDITNGDVGKIMDHPVTPLKDNNEFQTNLVAMFSSYLSWWRQWEATGVPLLQGLNGVDARPLQEHLTAHHGELLKLESELHHVLKLRGISYNKKINEQRNFSESSIQASDVSLQETRATQRASPADTTPRRRRVPYISRVRNMVSKFEVIANKELEASRRKVEGGCASQSLPCTPAVPTWDISIERPASVDNKRVLDSNHFKTFDPLTKDNQRKSQVSDNNQSVNNKQQGKFSSPDLRPIQDRDINSNFKQSLEDLAKMRLNEDGNTSISGAVLGDSLENIDINNIYNCHSTQSPSDSDKAVNEVSSFSDEEVRLPLEYGFDYDNDDDDYDNSDNCKRGNASPGVYQYKVVPVKEESSNPEEDRSLLKVESFNPEEDRSLLKVDMEIESNAMSDLNESGLYNNSHLMKLMREVTDQREQISHLREQLTLEEDKKEENCAKLNHLRRIFLQVVHYTYEWTEAVRKEWLTTTTTTEAQTDGEDEKQDLSKTEHISKELSKSPQQQTNHLRHQQKQLDNDEIELLIRTRCGESGCVDSQDDLDKDIYLSPETVAVELERELLALKLHVARSHALLHQYQSSSLHGSRSEISTPTNTLQKTGVGGTEVPLGGGECQLCGPGHMTTTTKASTSTATQTSPASPTSVDQEDRSSVAGTAGSGATTATTASADEGPGSAAAPGGGGECSEGGASLLQESPTTDERDRQMRPGFDQMCESVVKEAPIAEQEEEEDDDEVEEETVSVSSSVEMSALTSDHALYSPKPNYEQLDHYSGLGIVDVSPSLSPSASQRRSPDDQKQRRSGLTVVANQGGVSGLDSSESDGAAESDLEESKSDKTALLARRRPPRLQHTRSPVSSGAISTSVHGEAARHPSSSSSGTPSVDENEVDTFDEDALQKPRNLRALQRGASSVGPISIEAAFATTPIPTVDTSSSSSTSNISVVGAAADAACSNTTEEQQPPNLTNTSEYVEGLQETTTTTTTTTSSTEGFQRGRSVSVFPSLQDNYLRALGLTSDIQGGNENLSEQEIQNKFSQLSLAFKTDKLTLRQRLDVQRRHRDTAETNMEAEVSLLKKTINGLHVECMDSDLADSVSQVGRCLDVLGTAAEGLVTASEDKLLPIYVVRNSNNEVWGAVQQEWRVSLALEVFLLHVENVKRMYEKDHQELQETRKLLTEYHIPYPRNSSTGGNSGNQSPGISDAPAGASRRIRALSLAGSPRGQSGSNSDVADRPPRRVSLGAFLKGGASGRRASLMPDLGLFREQLSAVAAAAVAANKEKEKDEEKGEEKRSNTTGRSNAQYSAITEEGSDSGGSDTQTSPSSPASSTSPSNTTSTTTTVITEAAADASNTHADLVATSAAIAKTLEELHPDLFTNMEEHSCVSDYALGSPTLSMAADSTSPATPTPLSATTQQYVKHTASWVWDRAEGVVGWLRGGHWPYSPQQTVQGARYAFTSLLLLLAALFLLFTISSGDGDLPEPRHPGWTTLHHVMHPFVSIRRIGAPPT